MRDPIFIGSAPSSGSTLLRVILGRHPSIASGGEVALFDKRNLLRESPASYQAHIQGWLDVGYPADYLGPSEELFEELDEYPWDRSSLREMCLAMPDYFSMVETFFRRNVQAQRAERWLDKCPSNIYCFDLIAHRYPGALFIHIIRDARDSIISYCRRGAPPFRAVSRWYFANLCGIQYSGRPNYLQVRYEELVQDTETVVRRICAFLNEPYLDGLLQPEGLPRKPRHAGWRHSERGPVGTGSVGQFSRAITQEQRAIFSHVRVSLYGTELLYKPAGAPEVPSPLELQELLGYGTACLAGADELSPAQLQAAWDDFEQYRWQMRFRYGVDIECPVILEGAGTKAS